MSTTEKEKTESYLDEVIKPLYNKISELTQENANLQECVRQLREAMKDAALETALNPDTDISNPPGSIGEEDPSFVICDEGAKYLAAISELEENGITHYLGWHLNGMTDAWWASKNKDFMVRMPSAKDLVMAVYTLEQANVTTEIQEMDDRPGDPPEG